MKSGRDDEHRSLRRIGRSLQRWRSAALPARPSGRLWERMERQALHDRYTAALDALIAQVKPDRSILAMILCGSLSHDTVWAKSDIDLAVVTIDDKQITEGDLAIYADGVNVHAILIPRTQFRALVEGVRHSSFINSFLGKGRLLYTHDPTIADLFARLRQTGDRDRQLELLRAGCSALPPIDKAHKWF